MLKSSETGLLPHIFTKRAELVMCVCGGVIFREKGLDVITECPVITRESSERWFLVSVLQSSKILKRMLKKTDMKGCES